MAAVKKIPLILFLYTCVHSKTIRSRIYTTGNGTKELSFDNRGGVNQQDIESLLRNLKEINITTEMTTESPRGADVADKSDELKENILMQHWNSLTELGWRNSTKPSKKLYLNNTRILKLAPEFKLDQEEGNKKEEGVKDELNATYDKTTERPALPDGEESSTVELDLHQSVVDLCQILQSGTSKEDLIDCWARKNKTVLEVTEKREASCCGEESPTEPTENVTSTTRLVAPNGPEETSRTLLRPRRLLQKVLLPLLVILVIKYLVTLPFVALSVFTLNAMWLGLLSIGAVIFAKFKGHDYFSQKLPNRRLAHIPGGEVFDVGTPLATSEIFWSPVRVPLAQTSIGTQS